MNIEISSILKDVKTYSRNIIKNLAARRSHLLRLALTTLLLVAGSMVNGAWATDYTFHIRENDGTTDVTSGSLSVSDANTTISIPNVLKRYGCDYTLYWLDGSTKQPLTEGTSTYSAVTGTDIYAEFTLSSICPVIFSESFETATWYNMRFYDQNADPTVNNYNLNKGLQWFQYFTTSGYVGEIWTNVKNNNDNPIKSIGDPRAYFAFIGNPYAFKVVNKYGGSTMSAKYESNYIKMRTDGITWTWEAPTQTGHFKIVFPDTYGNAEKTYWDCASASYDNNARVSSWTTRNTNARDIYIQQAPATITFHILRGTDGSEVTSFTAGMSVGDNISAAYAASATERLHCTSTTFYSDAACTQAITTLPTGVTDIYTPFEVDYAALKSQRNIVFSTSFENAKWMNIAVIGRGAPWLQPGDDKKLRKNDSADGTEMKSQFAFIGDPYEFRIVSRYLGNDYDLQSNGGSGNTSELLFKEGTSNAIWSLYYPAGNQSDRFRIQLNSNDYNTMWDSNNPVVLFHNLNSNNDEKAQAGIYTYHVITQSGKDVMKSVIVADGNLSNTLAMPDVLKRKFISEYKLYYIDPEDGITKHYLTQSDAQKANGMSSDSYQTLADADVYEIYVDYTVSGLPFETVTGYADADAKKLWYNMHMGVSSSWLYNQRYDSQYNAIINKPDAQADRVADAFMFAFVGDPYELKIINRYSGGDYYLGVASGHGDNTDIYYSDAINSTGICTWEIIDDLSNSYGYTSTQFALRQFNSADNPRYVWATNGQVMRYKTSANYGYGQTWVDKAPISIEVTYEVYNAEGELMTSASAKTIVGSTPSLPEIAERLGCDYTYHSESTTGPVLNTITEETEKIYVTYTVNTANLPFTFSTDYEHATWYNMQIPHYGTNTWIYDNGYNGVTKSSPDDLTNPNTYYAFTGDPYRMRILNMSRGSGFEAQHSGNDSYSQLVRFQLTQSEAQWGLVKPVTPGEHRFQVLYLPTEHNDKPSYISGSTGYLNLTNTRASGFDEIQIKSADDDIYVQAVTKTYYALTYEVYNADKVLEASLSTYYSSGDAITVVFPEVLKRCFCNYSELYDTFNGTAFSNTGGALPTTMPTNNLTFYVQYTLTEKGLKIFSSSVTEAKWFRLKNYRNGYTTIKDDGTIENIATFDATNNDHYEWSFVGTPYGFRAMNRNTEKYLKAASGDDRAAVNAMGNLGEDYIYWEAYVKTGYATNESSIILKDTWNNTNVSYFYPNDKRLAIEGINSGGYFDFNFEISQTYTWNIVDKQGRIAVKYTETLFPNTPISVSSIPSAIYSPYIEEETITFYSTAVENGTHADGRAQYTLSNQTTVTPATSDIYVTYTTDKLMEKPLHLRGVRGFKVKFYGNQYIYDNNGTLALTTTESSDRKNLWHFKGVDPYAVEVMNVSNTDNALLHSGSSSASVGYGTSDANRYFILMKNDGVEDNPEIELVAATGANLSETDYYSMGRTDGTATMLSGTDYAHGSSQITLNLSVGNVDVTYSIVARDGRIVVKDIENSSDGAPSLPTEWCSPLAKNFQYWLPTQFTVTGSGDAAIYTNPTGNEVASVTEAVDGVIFVTYDVDESKGVDLDGRSEDTGKMYLLKYINGESFRQEDGSDGFRTTATKGIYPYSNGDTQLYIYGDEQLVEQQDGASSTRTRWAWYLEGNDPYRVKISSFQTQAAEGSTDRHAFLRTYKPEGYNQIVTGVITDNSSAVNSGQLPTEYIILNGTGGHYKLMTNTKIADASNVEDYRTVTSFEQYWKNKPTALKQVGTVTNETLTDAQRDILENLGWHGYEAWANAEPWVNRSDGSTGKKYEYKEHWYQTIDMGNGDFDLKEIELSGALILLDQHGWEVMRKPIAKTGHSQKATRDAAIRVYDSPMVKQYHFWTNYKKEDGYHKYKPTTNANKLSDNVKHQKTGTSLAQYPEVAASGTLADIYVTYEVKDAYAQSYTGAATKGGTSSTSFYVRQDGATTYAKATSATTLATETVADILNATDEALQWKLHPNFDIDTEMGYRYQDDSQHQYDELTQADTEAAYLANTEVKDYTTETPTVIYTVTYGQNAFDPYNMQLESVAHPGNFFTTNASKVIRDGFGGMTADGTSSTIALSNGSPAVDATDYYDIGTGYQIIHSTNTTFMVTDDGNGNMRLMPRFDHGMRATSVTTLTANAAAVAADDDCSLSPQTVLFQQARMFTYVVIDNQGREALRFTSSGDVNPKMKQRFTSPLATNFTFYTSTANATAGTTAITTLIGTPLTDNTVYVRYDYDPSADTQGLLKGTWVTTKINSTDVQYSSGIKSVSPKSPTTAAQQWRLLQRSSGEQFDPDPYAVNLYNASLKSGSPETMTPINVNSNDRFVILSHPSTATGDYALLVAGTGDHNYAFLNGSNLTSGATTAVVSTYATDGTLTNAEQVVFTADVAPEGTITYKIITNTGKVALTGTYTIESGKYTPSLPTRMRSPIMEDKESTYQYYTARNTDGTVNTMSQTTTMRNLDDDHVLYVHYDYEKSKSVFKDFVANNDQVNFNYATLDLSGKVPYALAVGSGNWLNNNGSVDAYDDSHNDYQYRLLRFKNYSWYLLGEDPYEVTMVSLQDSKVFGVKKPSATGEAGGVQAAACLPDEAYYKTFMILKGLSNTDNQYYSLNLYATGEDKLFIGRNGNAAYSYLDTQGYVERKNSRGRRSRDDGSYMYQRFWFRPNLIYSVITNEGKEAIWANSIKAYDTNEKQYNVTTFGIPQYIQSPLLNKSDFVYYSKCPTWNDEAGKLVTDETSLIDLSKIKTIADAAEARIGTVYVRYTYDRETSPYKIASAFNVNAADGTHLDWTGATGLDLSGNTWYNMANMRTDWSSAYGYAYGVNTTNPSRFEGSAVNTLGSNKGFSRENYLWKLVGDDPYAIRIYSCQYNDKCLSVQYQENRTWQSNSVQEYGASGYSCQTFMLLNLCASPTTPGAAAYSGYKMNRWPMLVATGAPMDNGGYVTLSTTHNESSALWYPNSVVTGDIRIGTGETEQRILTQMWGLNSGQEFFFDVEFVKAPVARKYRYHAINNDTGLETWTATFEHDWMMPVVLEDDICRLYTKY